MALLDDVKAILDRLAPHGWADFFQAHGLDIGAADLKTELLRDLSSTVDRAFPGMDDFALGNTQGIVPSSPSRSLLYHAMASPKVRWADPDETQPISEYPSWQEVDTIEDLVYGITPPSLEELRNAFPGSDFAIVVFANQYRSAVDTPHQKNADLVFSRTGVSRVGTEEALYDRITRSFSPLVETDATKIRILPAKYNAYLSVQLKGSPELLGTRFIEEPTEFNRFRGTPKDEDLGFWFPIHKLFPGESCIAGLQLDLAFSGNFKNEKLKRIHLFLNEELNIETGFSSADLDSFPFVVNDIAQINSSAGSAMVMPSVKEAMVEKVQNPNGSQVLFNKSFQIPAENNRGKLDLFFSSLELRSLFNPAAAPGFPRSSPEYMHIRTEIEGGTELNLNEKADMMEFLIEEPFQALHYFDFAGDGFLTIAPIGDLSDFPILPAYTLITAPDFFPFVEQSEILNETIDQMDIWSTPPLTLADIRALPNIKSHPELDTHPGAGIWNTVTSLIPATLDNSNIQATTSRERVEKRVSYLTDGAAGIFAPGWDVSFDIIQREGQEIPHLASYGLGSPFPEDAKLCAALSSFWPAVAPDITRSFWPTANTASRRTIVPLLDHEIGANGERSSWDGEKGPQVISKQNGTFVRYKKIEYVDYTLNTLGNRFDYQILSGIDAIEYKRRLIHMRQVYSQIFSRLFEIFQSRAEANRIFSQLLLTSYSKADGNDGVIQFLERQHRVQLEGVIDKFIFHLQDANRTAVDLGRDEIEVKVEFVLAAVVDQAGRTFLSF